MEELDFVNGSRPKELHTIIIWDASHKALADTYLNNLVEKRLIRILYQEVIRLTSEIELKLGETLYNSTESRAVNGSIYLIIIEDQNPMYKFEQATSCEQVLNYQMFIIKKELREIISIHSGYNKSIYYYVHTSYNNEETSLVLNALDLEILFARKKNYPDIKSVFTDLNNHPHLKYVVQRSFSDLANPSRLEAHDVDVLVNDYYLFKAITGATSINKTLMREREDGYFIQNEIPIGEIKVAFDVRYLGDNFNDVNFQKDTLATRVSARIDDFDVFVPNSTYHLYTLLYTVLIQKADNPKKEHFETIAQLYKELHKDIGFDFANYTKADRTVLWNDLLSFMHNRNYRIVKPKDKNVKLFLPDQYRQQFQNDFQLDFFVDDDNHLAEVGLSLKDLDKYIPLGSDFIFIDGCTWKYEWVINHNPLPFLEKFGKYWGNPADDTEAIAELKRQEQNGITHVIIARPAFWWLEYYKEWHNYLRSNYSCILENERLVIFNLHKK